MSPTTTTPKAIKGKRGRAFKDKISSKRYGRTNHS